jgi:hypothetical protein
MLTFLIFSVLIETYEMDEVVLDLGSEVTVMTRQT